MSEMCLHCKINKGNHRRNLCQTCYKDRNIRAKYPSLKQGRKPDPVLNSETGRLCELNTYKPEAWDFCLHGLADGECPICEREQRAGLVMLDRPHQVNHSPARMHTRLFRSRPSRRELVA